MTFNSIFLKQLLIKVHRLFLPHGATIGRTGIWRLHLIKPANMLRLESKFVVVRHMNFRKLLHTTTDKQ